MDRLPVHCPTCRHDLTVTHLRCSSCGREVDGAFSPLRLVNLDEPHATLLEHFLRVRGNMREMERELGLAYSTVRSRLDEAFTAVEARMEPSREERQEAILDRLDRGEITVPEAVTLLQDLRQRRQA